MLQSVGIIIRRRPKYPVHVGGSHPKTQVAAIVYGIFHGVLNALDKGITGGVVDIIALGIFNLKYVGGNIRIFRRAPNLFISARSYNRSAIGGYRPATLDAVGNGEITVVVGKSNRKRESVVACVFI